VTEPAGGRTLDAKLVAAMIWSAVSFGGGQVATFASILVLARLLEPTAFGIVALAMTFLAFLQYLQESGLWAAIIYRRSDDLDVAAASAAAFAPAVGFLLYAPCFVVAPVAAHLLREPRLTDVLRVLALMLLPRSLAIAPLALLERALEYRAVAKAELSAALTQAAVSIALAAAGLGVWSLVFGALAGATAQTTLLWALVPTRPRLSDARFSVLREMMRYGRYVGAANILNVLNRTVDNVTIGRVLGAAPLAFYATAFRIASLPMQVFGTVVGRGLFSAYAALQHDRPQLRDVYIQGLQRLGMLALPVSAGIAVAADPLVRGLLGPRWMPAVVPLQILSLFAIVRTFSSTTGEVWLALGKPHLRLVWEIAHTALVVPALIVLTVAFGVKGKTLAMLGVDIATGVPAIVVTMVLLQFGTRRLVSALLPAVLCTTAVVAVLWVVTRATGGMSSGAALASVVLAGAAAYAAGAALFGRSVLGPMWLSLRSPHPAGS
jgi:O-antigen/teichoic acid export membrane protein